MKCSVLELFATNGMTHKYYYVLVIFFFGAVSNIVLNKYWNYVLFVENQPKQLIVRRPFSIVDFDGHEIFDTDQSAHELIVRETDVDVICK